MAFLVQVVIGIVIAFLILYIGLRVVKKWRPLPCPYSVRWVLACPPRRRFFSPARTLDWIGLREGMRVLELGPGPGYLSIEAARRLGQTGRLYALDIQPQMLAEVRKRSLQNGTAHVELILGDATALPFRDSSLDLAFLVAVLGEVPDQEGALRELYRVLKPGGVLSVTEMLPDPDYSLPGTTAARCQRVGLQFSEKRGNLFYYTLNFVKPKE